MMKVYGGLSVRLSRQNANNAAGPYAQYYAPHYIAHDNLTVVTATVRIEI